MFTLNDEKDSGDDIEIEQNGIVAWMHALQNSLNVANRAKHNSLSANEIKLKSKKIIFFITSRKQWPSVSTI